LTLECSCVNDTCSPSVGYHVIGAKDFGFIVIEADLAITVDVIAWQILPAKILPVAVLWWVGYPAIANSIPYFGTSLLDTPVLPAEHECVVAKVFHLDVEVFLKSKLNNIVGVDFDFFLYALDVKAMNVDSVHRWVNAAILIDLFLAA